MLVQRVDLGALSEFSSDEDIIQSVRAREKYYGESLLRHAVKEECGDDELVKSIVKGLFGKPFFQRSGIYYSLSHSNCYFVLGISLAPLGIDIESMNDIEKLNSSLWLSDYEKKDKSIQSNCDYLKMWTVKEAVLKLYGTGFRVMPHNLTIKDLKEDTGVYYENGSQIRLKVALHSTDQLIPNYCVSIASFQQLKTAIKIYYMNCN